MIVIVEVFLCSIHRYLFFYQIPASLSLTLIPRLFLPLNFSGN
jgi:hypothetical protein